MLTGPSFSKATKRDVFKKFKLQISLWNIAIFVGKNDIYNKKLSHFKYKIDNHQKKKLK